MPGDLLTSIAILYRLDHPGKLYWEDQRDRQRREQVRDVLEQAADQPKFTAARVMAIVKQGRPKAIKILFETQEHGHKQVRTFSIIKRNTFSGLCTRIRGPEWDCFIAKDNPIPFPCELSSHDAWPDAQAWNLLPAEVARTFLATRR